MAVVCACRDCSSGKADDRANASKKAEFAVLSFFAQLLPIHHFLRLLLRKMQKVTYLTTLYMRTLAFFRLWGRKSIWSLIRIVKR
uniref:Uncharacterized protein n=1 Tax=Trichuris muris TaxID=70415 RepID=A0A5S6Q592_TRIMR